MVKQISGNEIYLLIKYIKNVLWRVAKHLSYIQDAWCLKVKEQPVILLNMNVYFNQRLKLLHHPPTSWESTKN